MFEYLEDMDFLIALDKLHLRKHYAKITLLTFDEKPIREIQGNITAGSVNVNGSSAIRRTISLTMLANENNSNIEDLDNEISIKRKTRIYIGLDNPLKAYQHYGKIVWFPLGLFILSSASIARTTTGWTISISGKDKMCLLDGTVGGTLPASVTFHESYIEKADGTTTIEYPTIFQIIFEAVNHWGGESAERIIITDIDEKVKKLMRYMGSNPIYFTSEYDAMSLTARTGFDIMKTYGQDAGYEDTDFIYPGELILKAGDTVVTLLDKIKNTLGNFEYFYDIDGNFIFQEIKNYLNQQSPLTELSAENYVKSYDNMKYLYSLTDLDTTVSINRNPKYDNIKNDFYVWGQREMVSGAKSDIRYHLAIDTKPTLDLALQCMWEVSAKIDVGDNKYDYLITRYDFTNNSSYTLSDFEANMRGIISNAQIVSIDPLIDTRKVEHARYEVTGTYVPAGQSNSESFDYIVTLQGLGNCNEWREELYRQALLAQVTSSVYDNYYDSELIAEWRKLYDPLKKEWSKYDNWNPAVFNDPGTLDFWLDFIDTSAAIGQYSINEIGRRTKVINEQSIKSIYNQEAPDIVFIKGANQDTIAHYRGMGQKFFILTPEYYDLFAISTTGSSCFDKIREMLYQNLNYNTTIQLTCLPKYYMEVNNIIHIEDRKSNINGNYQITQFSLPLAYNGTMSITATEVLTRV